MNNAADRPRLRTSAAAGLFALALAPFAWMVAGDNAAPDRNESTRADQGAERTPAQEADDRWPYEIVVPEGTLTIYQPQPEELSGNQLTSRTAVAAQPAGSDEQTFGAIWMTSRVEVDRDDRIVIIEDVTVERVRFPNATEEQQADISRIIEAGVPEDLVISLDRLITSLEMLERERTAANSLNNDPPVIEFRNQPAALIMIDGEPRLSSIPESSLMRVINTAFSILLDPSADAYYLFAGNDVWYTSAAIAGPWSVAPVVPAAVRAQQPPDPEADEVGDPLAQGGYDESPPLIVVATEPTELISTNGDPEFVRLGSTGLLYADNTDSFVFMELASQRFFLLLSGRWYRSASLEDGPWTFVPADELPEGFQNIDADSEAGSVLASVAGTDEALDAVLDAFVPQTAAVSRSATVTPTFDGEPQFEPIEQTSLGYAINTEYQIIEADGHYYLCHAATWFESDTADGTYRVAESIPDEIYEIPPESPAFNVRYVHIYEVRTDTVFVGYTSGYNNSFVHHHTVVWGTGWWHRPWIGVWFIPRPVTWGFHAHWNPWMGWTMGWSMGFGRFHFSVGWGSWHRGSWWGPRGYWAGARRGAFHGYRAGFRAGYRAGQRSNNAFRNQQWARSSIGDRARDLSNRPRTGDVANRAGDRPALANRPGAERPNNNVLADRDGNVFRQNEGGGIEQRQNRSWESRPELSRPELGDRAAPTQGNLSTRNRPTQGNLTNRAGTGQSNANRGTQLQRSQMSRDRGTARTNNFNRARPSGGRAGGARRPID